MVSAEQWLPWGGCREWPSRLKCSATGLLYCSWYQTCGCSIHCHDCPSDFPVYPRNTFISLLTIQCSFHQFVHAVIMNKKLVANIGTDIPSEQNKCNGSKKIHGRLYSLPQEKPINYPFPTGDFSQLHSYPPPFLTRGDFSHLRWHEKHSSLITNDVGLSILNLTSQA